MADAFRGSKSRAAREAFAAAETLSRWATARVPIVLTFPANRKAVMCFKPSGGPGNSSGSRYKLMEFHRDRRPHVGLSLKS